MDILNFISWIKRGDYRATLPTDTTNLFAVGAKDPKRDDTYRPLSINAEPLQSLYDGGAVTQTTSSTTAVTLNAHHGTIDTVSLTLAANANTQFVLNNSKILGNSIILLTPQTGSNGTVVLEIRAKNTGTATIRVHNCGTATMNGNVKINFMIIDRA